MMEFFENDYVILIAFVAAAIIGVLVAMFFDKIGVGLVKINKIFKTSEKVEPIIEEWSQFKKDVEPIIRD